MWDEYPKKSPVVKAMEWVAKKNPATGDWISESKAVDGVPYLVEVRPNEFSAWTMIDNKWPVGGEPAPHGPGRIAEIKP